ncbi:nuclear receptor coactivator 7 isoform X3 [Amia ocellicauda]|uniref:nuclear receptor coactivator 7 isoform X3 n=1 Tax=Amia ocellicauda TaxID=2972642 RepID=UPI0034641F27
MISSHVRPYVFVFQFKKQHVIQNRWSLCSLVSMFAAECYTRETFDSWKRPSLEIEQIREESRRRSVSLANLSYGGLNASSPKSIINRRPSKVNCWSLDCAEALCRTGASVSSHLFADDNRNKNRTKKEKRRVIQKPVGTVEYTAGPQDTLNCIALKFNITPNRLVEINRLFSHTIVPGQTLYVPDVAQQAEDASSLPHSPSSPASTLSSTDQEFDKLSDADFARKSSKPIQRVLSSASEEEEPMTVKFLKMSCRYITDGKGVVGGVMIVTPNNIMFDPHKSDPLVIENGCEEYGLICPMEEVVSIALYNDISHMKIKDALPSPGEWEDLSSEQDINPFSRFKALNKEKRQAHMDEVEIITPESETTEKSQSDEGFTEIEPPGNTDKLLIEPVSSGTCIPVSDFSQADQEAMGPVVFEQDQPEDEAISNLQGTACPVLEESEKGEKTELEKQGSLQNTQKTDISILKDIPKGKALKGSELPDELSHEENALDTRKLSYVDSTQSEILHNSKNEACSYTTAHKPAVDQKSKRSCFKEIEVSGKLSQSEADIVSEVLNGDTSCLLSQSEEDEQQQNSESEMKSWLFKRIQGPIEDMLVSKEEKSKNPPMFLCFKVGKPMRKTFASQSTSPAHQYGRRGKQPEYWFAVPQERVDHLYAFFVQWSPEIYGKDAKEQGFIVVEKDELNMIDNFFSDPTPKSWEIITVNEAKRRQSCGSYDEEEEDVEDLLPVLIDDSVLLEEMHIERLAQRLPARTQGYPWRLVYSTAVHGSSLKTLYRNLAQLDNPVLLVIKDMDNRVFGALTSHPFRVSDHCYGTGETFLYTFSPEFKMFRWSGENSYFIKGDTDSIQLGCGGGHFGLWMDADLYHGSSYPCHTFHNEPLSKKEDFIIQELEVWTFE